MDPPVYCLTSYRAACKLAARRFQFRPKDNISLNFQVLMSDFFLERVAGWASRKTHPRMKDFEVSLESGWWIINDLIFNVPAPRPLAIADKIMYIKKHCATVFSYFQSSTFSPVSPTTHINFRFNSTSQQPPWTRWIRNAFDVRKLLWFLKIIFRQNKNQKISIEHENIFFCSTVVVAHKNINFILW